MLKNTKKYIAISIIIVVVSGMYHYKDAIYLQLDGWSLIPRQERFTELYFNNYNDLPKKIIKDRKKHFSFVIRNLEGETKEYPYKIYFKSQDNQIINIKEDIITLTDGEYEVIEESYAPVSKESAGGIFVELTEKQQQIHFLVVNK